MWSKIIFFELRHYGDLHITRNFVRYVIDHIPAKSYVYVLVSSDSKVFSDFPELSFETYDATIHPFTIYSPWKVVGDVLYVNTSCGTNEMAFYNGTTLQTAFAVFDHYLRKFCDHALSNDLVLFVPYINFASFKVENVNRFVSANPNRKMILVVNGDVLSGQSSNLDLYPLVQLLAYKHPELLFLLTDVPPSYVYRWNRQCDIRYAPEGNIYCCKDIIYIDENDIVETAYFSLFCDVIIGRSSGVYTLSIERRNVFERPRKFICFSHTEQDKDMGLIRQFPRLANNFVWSNDFRFGSMLDLIEANIHA